MGKLGSKSVPDVLIKGTFGHRHGKPVVSSWVLLLYRGLATPTLILAAQVGGCLSPPIALKCPPVDLQSL